MNFKATQLTNRYRSRFPIFEKNPELVYLDNAATTQKPASVISAVSDFYSESNANIHRGVYDLSNQASDQYENARKKVADYIGADGGNIAFTSGATESVNMVAKSYLAPLLKEGDNIVVSVMEHHSNYVPWQQLAKEKGVEFRIAPVTESGDLDYSKLDELLDVKTKMLAITHISNSLGTENDLDVIVDKAHRKGIPVTVDAAQSAAFYELNQKEIEYDFLAFSGHKMFATMGTGVLFVADQFIDKVRPFNFGGGMISSVSLEETSFAKYPKCLEAGTPNVSGIVGLSTALDFLNELEKREARDFVNGLGEYCREELSKINGLTMVGNPTKQSGIVSFLVNGIHPHDVASFLNKDGIAVRAGMHCTQPLLNSLGVQSTVRASFSIYNSNDEIDQLKSSLIDLKKFW